VITYKLRDPVTIIDDELPRPFHGLPADHPAIGVQCPGCAEPIRAGDMTALVAIGPGDDADQQERAAAGQPFHARAVLCHYNCVVGCDHRTDTCGHRGRG
jgi:hypothetical protein